MNDESLLQFPCDFPIKIMGTGGSDFRPLVVELVRLHAPDLDENRITLRDSSRGRYQAVTIVVRARNRGQLDAIYQDLSGHPRVAVVL
ncbi:MAG TPA: DUF493 domain-containing protein [Candidatus Competibacteraceae bacterium]|nr:DUF493 domain-containing protein [Candidatus Competibacteraceae bacterium]MCP5134290.1 DUF493 domain-containing protein [Gammaproteobacteria bacterium]HPF59501.1 DUF493 domain-containing protein [Candidatus Competibacteraceae bacterium]HRY19269.1 DUF493 domain-containing protein [Candidatus Competibacteraceae bacterium]